MLDPLSGAFPPAPADDAPAAAWDAWHRQACRYAVGPAIAGALAVAGALICAAAGFALWPDWSL